MGTGESWKEDGLDDNQQVIYQSESPPRRTAPTLKRL